MADLSQEFERAVEDVQTLPRRPDNDTLLRLYGLYKQATEGNVAGPRPPFFDFVGTAKHEAWAALKGISRKQAQREYVELVNRLLG